jgi:uncharacterized protein
MLERDEYPAGVPCWVDIEQEDTEAAMAFYGGLFGWEFARSADSPDPYYRAQLRIAMSRGSDSPGETRLRPRRGTPTSLSRAPMKQR